MRIDPTALTAIHEPRTREPSAAPRPADDQAAAARGIAPADRVVGSGGVLTGGTNCVSARRRLVQTPVPHHPGIP